MKNTKTSSVFITVALLVAIALMGSIWWGISDMFGILTHNDWLASLVAIVVVLALTTYLTARLRADDVRTASLTTIMALVGSALVVIMFVATSFYKSSGEDITQVGESLAWAIPLSFALPVLIGNSFFIIETLDKWWGHDKKPVFGGVQGKFVDIAYKGQYNIGIIAALGASAIGTYSVMYTVTQSFWHSILYVASVEVAIYLFTSWTHRTQDRMVFWVSFTLAQAAFFLAILFQFGNAGQNITGMGLDTNILEQMGSVAVNYSLIPPLLVGLAFGGLYAWNQTKRPELFAPTKSEPRGEDSPRRFAPRDEQHYVKRDTPEIRVSRPDRPQPMDRPQGMVMFNRSGQDNQRGNKGSHGKQDFAEPGGLPEPLVARLKSIGYSGNAIRKMNLEQAQEAARKPLVMAGDAPSKNGTEPKEPTGENFN